MFKNVASQKVIVFAFDATTNVPKTGDAANISAYISKDFGAVTQLGDTSATEMDATNAPGYYLFDITQTETNADVLLVSGKSSTANIKVIGAPATIFTLPTNFGATSIDSNGRLDIAKAAGTAWGSGAITAASIAADAITAAKIADGAIDAATFAAGAINAAAIADGAIDRATFAADTGLLTARSNTAQAGGASTITLDASASATDDFYKGAEIRITGGTGVGQARTVTLYVGATKVATVDRAWITNPDNTSTFAVMPLSRPKINSGLLTTDVNSANLDASVSSRLASASYTAPLNAAQTADAVWDEDVASHNVSASFGAELELGKLYSESMASNGVSVAAAGIQASSFAANAIDASALAADAVDEILDEVVEGTFTFRQYLKLFAAALAGKLSGAATTTITIRNPGDSKDRIIATVDANGNRSALTLDVT